MNKQVLRHDKHCRICGGDRISTVFKLNDTPLEDQFVSKEDVSITQPVFPLELAICDGCGYVHLPHIINPEASYNDYVYVSGLTVGLRNHYDQYAKDIVGDFGVADNSLVVDLGSNDGSMLASFKRAGMRVLGVEPAGDIATLANDSGLTTINDFFTGQVVSKILEEHGPASVITANYMYANIDDVIDFTRNAAKTLGQDGIFVVQTGYHPEQMRIKMFDYIYHEHFSYFTVDVLRNLFASCGLELIHAEKTAPKGGSVRIVGQLKNGARPVDGSVQQLIDEEGRLGMQFADTYRKFSHDIADSKGQLLELLKKFKADGKKIAGFGASHSTTTLIYHFDLAPFIDFLVDDNPVKQGLFSPGHHIPVYSAEKLYENNPDYVIILGWQHRNSIMAKHKDYIASNGHWIVPLPELLVE